MARAWLLSLCLIAVFIQNAQGQGATVNNTLEPINIDTIVPVTAPGPVLAPAMGPAPPLDDNLLVTPEQLNQTETLIKAIYANNPSVQAVCQPSQILVRIPFLSPFLPLLSPPPPTDS